MKVTSKIFMMKENGGMCLLIKFVNKKVYVR